LFSKWTINLKDIGAKNVEVVILHPDHVNMMKAVEILLSSTHKILVAQSNMKKVKAQLNVKVSDAMKSGPEHQERIKQLDDMLVKLSSYESDVANCQAKHNNKITERIKNIKKPKAITETVLERILERGPTIKNKTLILARPSLSLWPRTALTARKQQLSLIS